jgi:hypothetical protein
MSSADSLHPTNRDAPKGAKGALTGTTTASPSCPVEGLESCPPHPVSDVKLNVTSLANGATTPVSSDDHGQFRVVLAAGNYRVELVAAPEMNVTTDLPATVSIIERQETRLDIRFDSGIR